VATIGRTVGQASVIGSADMLVLLGLALILAPAIALGIKRAPYLEPADASFAVNLAPHSPRDSR
jgi:hypothetical protein